MKSEIDFKNTQTENENSGWGSGRGREAGKDTTNGRCGQWLKPGEVREISVFSSTLGYIWKFS